MHRSSYTRMSAFRDAYLGAFADQPLKILDVGSGSIGGDAGYRPLFQTAPWEYVGLDVAAGPNVDIVATNPYEWSAIADGAFDVVISGQAFEHIEWPWLTIREIARITRGNGLVAITAPSAGPVHRFPLDCWRYYPDGLPALASYGGFRLLERFWDNGYAYPENAMWGDAFVVLQRPARTHEAPGPISGPLENRRALSLNDDDALRQVPAWRVKARLIAASLRRAYEIYRAPLSKLTRH